MKRKFALTKKQCVTCKKDFIPKKITSKNCSRICMAIYNRNKISRQTQERRDRVAKKLDATPQVACKTCGKMFAPISATRINCSHKCAISYNYTNKRERKVKPQEGLFRKFTIGSEKDVPKQMLRSEIDLATAKFLANGGKIQKCDPEISPKTPSVGSIEWNWDAQESGYFSEEAELPESEYILADLLPRQRRLEQ
mgnify:CR=1 FL=1